MIFEMDLIGVPAGQPAWMAYAWRELGQSEIAGNRHNPRILQLYRDAGHPEIARDEVAWCAAFVGACLERAGLPSTRSLMARSYLAWGTASASARHGCIAVFSRGSDAAAGHVGFWIGEADNTVFVLGGNQGDRVSVAAMGKDALLGYRWPEEGLVSSADAPTEEPAAAPPPTTEIFELALSHVLEMEGGFSDDPYDPGGPTNFGITLADFAHFKGARLDAANRATLVGQLKRISRSDVRQIYLDDYWRPSQSEALPAALALVHFDAAVNHGLGASAKMLQTAVGAEVDGEIGPRTLAKARAADPAAALDRYAEIRRQRYRSLPHFWRFGRGWLRRVDTTVERAREIAGQAIDANAIPAKTGDEEMSQVQTEGAPMTERKWWGQSMTIWGTMITAASTVLPVLAPLIGLDITPDLIKQVGDQTLLVVQAAGGLIGTVLAIYGRSRATRQLERRAISLQL